MCKFMRDASAKQSKLVVGLAQEMRFSSDGFPRRLSFVRRRLCSCHQRLQLKWSAYCECDCFPALLSISLLLNLRLSDQNQSVAQCKCDLFFLFSFPASKQHQNQSIKQQAFQVLPYVEGLSEQLRRCLQQRVRAVFKSKTTPRSHLVRPKDPA